MNIELQKTGDGSHTLYNELLGDTYHSSFGAIQESEFIFIKAGLEFRLKQSNQIQILEVGMGTGLNVILSLAHVFNTNVHLNYHALEPFPLPKSIVSQLNYPEILNSIDFSEAFEKLHGAKDGVELKLAENFNFTWYKDSLESFKMEAGKYDVVFFDVFSPNVQPELWTSDIFTKIFLGAAYGSVLTTYSSKGSVRRAMSGAGFSVEKIPGPEGKREITRAIKQI